VPDKFPDIFIMTGVTRGRTDEQVAVALTGSAEYFQNRGGGTNDGGTVTGGGTDGGGATQGEGLVARDPGGVELAPFRGGLARAGEAFGDEGDETAVRAQRRRVLVRARVQVGPKHEFPGSAVEEVDVAEAAAAGSCRVPGIPDPSRWGAPSSCAFRGH